MQPTKKARLTATPLPPPPPPPPSSPPPLPLVVMDAIVSYAVPTSKELVTWRPSNEADGGVSMSKSFAGVALVSKEWYSAINKIASECALQSMKISRPSTRREMLQLRNALTHRRLFLTRLDILPGDGKRDPCKDAAFIRVVLSNAPHLQVLDMANVDLPSESAAEIVRFAARHCPALHSLLLPSCGGHQDQFRRLASAVFESASVWLKGASSAGGLRRLRLCMARFLTDVTSSTAFIDRVIACCPNFHDMSDMSYNQYYDVSSQELWQINLHTWKRFCETCTQLTTFDWRCVPFATSFFDVFGQHPKRFLRKLTLGTIIQWDGTQYLNQVDTETKEELVASGYAASATGIQRVLCACPQLRELMIRNDNTNAMKARIIDQAFCEALLRWCPLVESLTIQVTSERGRWTLSDATLQVLARLPWLCTVHLYRVTITGDGLFDLVVNHTAAATKKARSYVVTLTTAAATKSFYCALEDFLSRLADCDNGAKDENDSMPWNVRTVSLRLVNVSEIEDMGKEWSSEYFERLQSLVQRVQTTHPSLTLKGIVDDFVECDRSFASIHDFTIKGQPLGSSDGRQDDQLLYYGLPRIDDVFTKRVVRGAYNSYSQDEDEEEQEEEGNEYLYDYYDDAGSDDSHSPDYYFPF